MSSEKGGCLLQLRIVEGMYSVFVEDWFRIFTRDQIMVLRNEDYSDDVEGHIIDVFNFLNVGESQDQATIRVCMCMYVCVCVCVCRNDTSR